MKVVVAAFNQEKALVGAFSVIVQPVVEPMDRFATLSLTPPPCPGCDRPLPPALLPLLRVRVSAGARGLHRGLGQQGGAWQLEIRNLY